MHAVWTVSAALTIILMSSAHAQSAPPVFDLVMGDDSESFTRISSSDTSSAQFKANEDALNDMIAKSDCAFMQVDAYDAIASDESVLSVARSLPHPIRVSHTVSFQGDIRGDRPRYISVSVTAKTSDGKYLRAQKNFKQCVKDDEDTGECVAEVDKTCPLPTSQDVIELVSRL